jgi:hypothetical protein
LSIREKLAPSLNTVRQSTGKSLIRIEDEIMKLPRPFQKEEKEFNKNFMLTLFFLGRTIYSLRTKKSLHFGHQDRSLNALGRSMNKISFMSSIMLLVLRVLEFWVRSRAETEEDVRRRKASSSEH